MNLVRKVDFQIVEVFERQGPGSLHQRDGAGRNVQLRVELLIDGVLHGRQRHLFEFIGGGLECVHFQRSEGAERRLVPVELIGRMPSQAGRFHLALSIDPRRRRDPAHYSPPECPLPYSEAVAALRRSSQGCAVAGAGGVCCAPAAIHAAATTVKLMLCDFFMWASHAYV